MKVSIACSFCWDARKPCDAWGVETLTHGCGKNPNHSGEHKCPCGARKKS